jgi:hypothetical protein
MRNSPLTVKGLLSLYLADLGLQPAHFGTWACLILASRFLSSGR